MASKRVRKSNSWPTAGFRGGRWVTVGTVVFRGAGHGPRGPLEPAPGPGRADHRWFGCCYRPGLLGRPAARAGEWRRRRSGPRRDSGDLLASGKRCRRPGRGRAVAARGAASGSPGGTRPRAALVLPSRPRGARRPRGPRPAASWGGGCRPRGSGGGGSRLGLMSKSMTFLGASLCSSPSSSKADRLPREGFLSLRKVSARRVSARTGTAAPRGPSEGQGHLDRHPRGGKPLTRERASAGRPAGPGSSSLPQATPAHSLRPSSCCPRTPARGRLGPPSRPRRRARPVPCVPSWLPTATPICWDLEGETRRLRRQSGPRAGRPGCS